MKRNVKKQSSTPRTPCMRSGCSWWKVGSPQEVWPPNHRPPLSFPGIRDVSPAHRYFESVDRAIGRFTCSRVVVLTVLPKLHLLHRLHAFRKDLPQFTVNFFLTRLISPERE